MKSFSANSDKGAAAAAAAAATERFFGKKSYQISVTARVSLALPSFSEKTVFTSKSHVHTYKIWIALLNALLNWHARIIVEPPKVKSLLKESGIAARLAFFCSQFSFGRSTCTSHRTRRTQSPSNVYQDIGMTLEIIRNLQQPVNRIWISNAFARFKPEERNRYAFDCHTLQCNTKNTHQITTKICSRSTSYFTLN